MTGSEGSYINGSSRAPPTSGLGSLGSQKRYPGFGVNPKEDRRDDCAFGRSLPYIRGRFRLGPRPMQNFAKSRTQVRRALIRYRRRIACAREAHESAP